MNTSECKKVLTLLLSAGTMVLIGLNIKFYEIFAKQHVYYSFFSIELPYNKISSESK